MTLILATLLAAGIGLIAGTAALLAQSSKRSLILSIAGHFCFCVSLVLVTTVIGPRIKHPAMTLDLRIPDKLILVFNLGDWALVYRYVVILALVVDIGVSVLLFRGTQVSRLARGSSATTTFCLALVVALATAATMAGVIELLTPLP